MSSSRKFQRTVENFSCEHCGHNVRGNGYTNHCPNCLWSKHVDVNPGDRLESCCGLMKPIAVIHPAPYRIKHECLSCGIIRKVKTASEDNFDAILEVVKSTP